jgi:hypothetical protein
MITPRMIRISWGPSEPNLIETSLRAVQPAT